MKVLLVNKYFYPRGGSENVFFDTGQLLREKGHEVIFFSMNHPQNAPSEYNKYFINNIDYEKGGLGNTINVSLKLLYSVEAKRKIKKLINESRPHIAHLHNIHHQMSPSILDALKHYNIPVVMTLHDYKMICASYTMLHHGNVCEDCKGHKYYYCFFKKCLKNSTAKSALSTVEMYLHHRIIHIYNNVDIFISPSNFLKNKLEEFGFGSKIVHLPNFLKLDEFCPQFGWNENSIVYCGRLSEEKGLFTLIEAVKNLDINLKIIGDGPIRENLKARVQNMGLTNVYFLGYMKGESLKDEIRKSMAVVIPSEWYENNPRSLIEAFALGKPVIGTRIGGIPELVKDNQTGITFEPKNAYDLSSKINNIINNSDQLLLMGKNARTFVENNLSAEIHFKSLMEVYEQALKKNAA